MQVALLLDPLPVVATDQVCGVWSVKLQKLTHPEWAAKSVKCVGINKLIRASESVKASESEHEVDYLICLPGKRFIPWCEVPIEEVAEDFEGFQEGFEVGRRLLVLDAQVDCLLQGLQKTPREKMLSPFIANFPQ